MPKPSMTGAAPSAAWDPIPWIYNPQPIARLEIIRIACPLAVLGFLSGRIVHAEDWLSSNGFHAPYMAGDWRQALPFSPVLPPWAAWLVVAAVVVSGLALAAGAWTRRSACVFAALTTFTALADRSAAMTVAKLAPVIAIALAASPAGARWSVDAWRRARREPGWTPPTRVAGGAVRFFQVLLPVFYFSSGIAKSGLGHGKAHGEWLDHSLVLWTQLHDSYQTWVSWFLANHVPAIGWTVLQWITLVFEIGAPLWFSIKWTRPIALAWAISMHFMIGIMFGPVLWFGLLMIGLLVGAYAPVAWIEWILTPSRWRRRGAAPEGVAPTT